jgi:putative SOS response-associated peptidase YedK
MCGRYVSVAADSDLVEEFDVAETVDDAPEPNWNVAPTDPVRAIMQRKPHGADDDAGTVRQLRTVRWGLVPYWSKARSGGAKMINARIETVTSKPAFAVAAARRRCLLPTLGYYEWQPTTDGKVPWFLHAPQRAPLAMAGLYEIWKDPELPDDHPDKWLWTSTVITRSATDLLGHIHDRCPVFVPPDLHAQWLDCSADDAAVAQRLLDAMPEPHLEPDVVSDQVNSVRNNGPHLIDPVDPQDLPGQTRLDLGL